jgi:hypothetical protein
VVVAVGVHRAEDGVVLEHRDRVLLTGRGPAAPTGRALAVGAADPDGRAGDQEVARAVDGLGDVADGGRAR